MKAWSKTTQQRVQDNAAGPEKTKRDAVIGERQGEANVHHYIDEVGCEWFGLLCKIWDLEISFEISDVDSCLISIPSGLARRANESS